jgi:hypothetical protein
MQQFIKTLQGAWFLILFIGSLILWYGTVTNQLKQLEATNIEQDNVLIELMKMKTDVEVIKTKVDLIYTRVK